MANKERHTHTQLQMRKNNFMVSAGYSGVKLAAAAGGGGSVDGSGD